MKKAKSKKLRYPEYIDGIKQVQCPFKRLCIRIWYSDWFRFVFVLCPIWLMALMIALMICFPSAAELIRCVSIGAYIVLFMAALAKNDYSELRKIGLDEYHQPLRSADKDFNYKHL